MIDTLAGMFEPTAGPTDERMEPRTSTFGRTVAESFAVESDCARNGAAASTSRASDRQEQLLIRLQRIAGTVQGQTRDPRPQTSDLDSRPQVYQKSPAGINRRGPLLDRLRFDYEPISGLFCFSDAGSGKQI